MLFLFESCEHAIQVYTAGGIGRICYKMYNCFVVFLHAVNGILGAGSYGIAMAKHSPYIRNISVAILKLQETSVLDSLWRKWWEYKSQCPKEKSGAGLL